MPRGTRKKSAASLPGLSAPASPAVKPIEKFHNALALSRWALKIVRGHALDSLRSLLNRREMEGIDAETGHTIFFNASIGSSLLELGDPTKVTKEALAAVVSGMSKATKNSRHARNGRKDATPEEDAEKLKVEHEKVICDIGVSKSMWPVYFSQKSLYVKNGEERRRLLGDDITRFILSRLATFAGRGVGQGV